MPPLDHLDTDFLGALARAGVAPESVDVVVNTHVHTDHVGWNTKRDGDSWVPTFPNARYLIPEADYRYFIRTTTTRDRPPAPRTSRRARTACESCSRTASLPSTKPARSSCGPTTIRSASRCRLRPAPGHTPGSSVLWLDAGKPAVFVGDLTHCPMQLHRPTDPCAFDEDFNAAAVTRKRVLTEASRRRAAVIPAHYPGHGGATVVARGDGSWSTIGSK